MIVTRVKTNINHTYIIIQCFKKNKDAAHVMYTSLFFISGKKYFSKPNVHFFGTESFIQSIV